MNTNFSGAMIENVMRMSTFVRTSSFVGIELAGVIVTSDEFNYPREVLDGFITDGVLAVDMETGSVAGVCANSLRGRCHRLAGPSCD